MLRHWVNACTDPQKYFENYDLYVDALQKLTHLERFAVYHEPLPSVTLSSLLSEKATCEMNMIARAWESNTRAAMQSQVSTGPHAQAFSSHR